MSPSRRRILHLGFAAGLALPGVRRVRAAEPLPLPPGPPPGRAYRVPSVRPPSGLPLPPLPPGGPAPMTEKPPFVMIDPGHGGKDTGTIGLRGVEEKTITLAVGLALRHALLSTGRFRVGMTRTRDVFVTLSERVALAMQADANLFFSLHCNEFSNSSVRGAIVFTLSRIASDRLAAQVANTENSFDRGPVDPALRGLRPDVATILGSLEMRATDLRSKRIASAIVASFRGHVPLFENPERSANFAVLRDPTVPSTLTEMGFLSNPEDERLLVSPAYRAVIAARITAAIGEYFRGQDLMRVAG